MKKLFTTLLEILALSICFAGSAQAYKIDTTATANAPWKVGEVLVEIPFQIPAGTPTPVHRVFLGITTEGHYVVQELYTLTKTKRTEPYVLMDEQDVTDTIGWDDTPGDDRRITGKYIAYHPNGKKLAELTANKNGRWNGKITWWYENGQIERQGKVKDSTPVGEWKEWDEDGKLIDKTNY